MAGGCLGRKPKPSISHAVVRRKPYLLMKWFEFLMICSALIPAFKMLKVPSNLGHPIFHGEIFSDQHIP
jgi:hypothetical protein